MQAFKGIPANENNWAGVKGVSKINHKIRKRHGLSCTEYVVQDFIDQLYQKYPTEPIEDHDCWENIGMSLDEFRTVADILLQRGLISIENKIIKPTSLWKIVKTGKDIPNEADVVLYFRENGYSVEAAKKAFKYYDTPNSEGVNWVDSKGNPVKNWKQKMITVWFKDENKARSTAESPTTKIDFYGNK